MGADTMTHKGSPSGGGAMVMMALWGLLAIFAIFMGAKAVDTPYAIHMFVFALAAILALIFKARSFGKPAAETVAELSRQWGANRVFLMVSGTLNRNTDEIEKIRRALGNRCAGTFDAMPPHTPRRNRPHPRAAASPGRQPTVAPQN